MDAVQGSTTNTINEIYTQFAEALAKQHVKQTWFTTLPNHCFIPSISALGFKNSNFDWNTRVDNRNLLCNNEINFDNYFIPPSNQPHVFLNTANVNWLTEEIDKGQPNCPKICTFAITGGVDPLCANVTSTYNLDANVPTGVTTQWVVSSNLQIISSTNNSITVKELTSSTATITATLINPCGANVVVTRQIIAGPPAITNITSSMTGSCNGSYQEWWLTATANGGVSNWLWTVDNPANNNWVIYSPNSPTTLVAVTGGGGISINATNSCGTGKSGVTIYSNCYGLVATPNPTPDDVTVSVAQPQQTLGNAKLVSPNVNKLKMYKIIVTDQLSNAKKQFDFSAGVTSFKLSLSGLVSGTYTIRAFDGTKWNAVQVIKQ